MLAFFLEIFIEAQIFDNLARLARLADDAHGLT